MRAVWLVLMVVSSLMSCDPGVEVENIPVDKLLNISSFVSPRDSSLKVYVFRASGLSERIPYDTLIEKTAHVTISDGKHEAVLAYYQDTKRYECKNPFHNLGEGSRLTLTVTTPDGATAVAHSLIPPKLQLTSFTHRYRNDFLFYDIVWNNTKAHQYFQAWKSTEFTIKNAYSGDTMHIKYNAAVLVEPEVYLWDRQPAGINAIRDSILTGYGRIGPAEVSVTLANIEEGLWKYITTSSQYESWLTNAEESGILPIFREPTEVFGNINGGFGIFASYNCTDSLIVKIDTELTPE